MADNTLLNSGVGGDTIRDIDKSGVKTQVVAIDAGGSGAESLVTLNNPLPMQNAATYFIFSAAGVNSSTTQLAAGATFTGTVESIQSQQTISILLTSDQPGVLHLIQYIDAAGTQVASDWTENIAANVPFSEAYTANGNYFRATFKNNGASATTTFNLNTAYGTLPSVSGLGNGMVALNEVNGTNFTLGQKAMTGSLPVVIASDQSAVTVTDPMASYSYNVAGAIAINTILLTIDCLADAAVSIQCVSMGTSGVVTPEWSNDNATWVAATTLMTQTGVPFGGTFSAAGLWTTHVAARYLRLRLSTATTAGTTTIYAQSISQPLGPVQAQPVVNPTAANLLAQVSSASGASSVFVQGAAASAATVAGNPVLMGGTFTTTLPTVTTGQAVNVQTTNRGEQLVAISSGATAVAVKAASTAAATTDPSLVVSVAGANSAIKIGDGTNNAAVKAASTAAAATDASVVVNMSPNMSVTASAVNSAATTNATSIKASAGTVFSITASNTGAAAAFVKFYNLATAPTVGTSTPIITLSIPASGTVNVPFGQFGYRFSTGIALAITNLAPDTDTTAVAAAQVKVLTSYN
jgi:hypothetical protein